MSAKAFERVFGPDWRKRIRDIRWSARHSVAEARKRTNQRLRHSATHPTDSGQGGDA